MSDRIQAGGTRIVVPYWPQGFPKNIVESAPGKIDPQAAENIPGEGLILVHADGYESFRDAADELWNREGLHQRGVLVWTVRSTPGQWRPQYMEASLNEAELAAGNWSRVCDLWDCSCRSEISSLVQDLSDNDILQTAGEWTSLKSKLGPQAAEHVAGCLSCRMYLEDQLAARLSETRARTCPSVQQVVQAAENEEIAAHLDICPLCRAEGQALRAAFPGEGREMPAYTWGRDLTVRWRKVLDTIRRGVEVPKVPRQELVPAWVLVGAQGRRQRHRMEAERAEATHEVDPRQLLRVLMKGGLRITGQDIELVIAPEDTGTAIRAKTRGQAAIRGFVLELMSEGSLVWSSKAEGEVVRVSADELGEILALEPDEVRIVRP